MSEPQTGSQGGIDNKSKIEVLLKEYEMLWGEILGRIRNRFAVIAYLGAVVAFVLFQSKDVSWPDPVWPLSLLGAPGAVIWPTMIVVVAGAFLVTIWWRFGSLINNAALRVAEIEQKINSLAGEELLLWESRGEGRPLFRWFYGRRKA